MSKHFSLQRGCIGVIIQEVGVVPCNWVYIIMYDIIERNSIPSGLLLEEVNQRDLPLNTLFLVSEGLRHSVIYHALSIYHPLTQRGLVVRAKYFGISHARGHRFRTAVSKS